MTDMTQMKLSDIARCPHYIIEPEHYRNDGSCKCDDPAEIIMIEWGYCWDGKQWVNPLCKSIKGV